jgi:hypothetical protein
MEIKDLFNFEMMDTPTLSAECHRIKAMIDTEAHLMFLGRGDANSKRYLQLKLKTAKAILKKRQLKLNF